MKERKVRTGLAPPNMAPRPPIPTGGVVDGVAVAAGGAAGSPAVAAGFFTTRCTVLPDLKPNDTRVLPSSRIRPA